MTAPSTSPPSWSTNGQWLVWASDRSGIPNILAAKVDNGQVASPVMLTNLRTGAAYPSVDPSGQWLYFSAYHVNGWEIERIPFNPHCCTTSTSRERDTH